MSVFRMWMDRLSLRIAMGNVTASSCSKGVRSAVTSQFYMLFGTAANLPITDLRDRLLDRHLEVIISLS
jgi:hypothetical protein